MVEARDVIDRSERSAGDEATASAGQRRRGGGVTRRTEHREVEAATVMITPGRQRPDPDRVRVVSNKP